MKDHSLTFLALSSLVDQESEVQRLILELVNEASG